jgi:hypothetical protein
MYITNFSRRMYLYGTLLMVIFGIIFLLYLGSKNNPYRYKSTLVDVQIVQDLAKLDVLPHKMRRILATDNLLQQYTLALLHVENQRLHFYSNNRGRFLFKVNILHHTLINVLHEKYIIPDGFYLFSLEDGVHTKLSWPILAFSSEAALVTSGTVVLIPDHEALGTRDYQQMFDEVRQGSQKYPWNKKVAKIFWRGASSGYSRYIDPNATFPRQKFIDYTRGKDFVSAGFTEHSGFYEAQDATEKQGYAAFSTKYALVPMVPLAESLEYKYLIDIDGYSCSFSRMAWLLRANSLIFKHASNKVQWYYHLLHPWVHYVPLKADFSDLYTQYQWAEAHPEAVQKIIMHANQLGYTTFTRENLLLATYQGLIKYHNLVLAMD